MCKFAITRKNNAFIADIVNTRLTKVFMVIFALALILPNSATLHLRISLEKYKGQILLNNFFRICLPKLFAELGGTLR